MEGVEVMQYPKPAKCHPERRHYGHGLCQQCWREQMPPVRGAEKVMAPCHPDQIHWAKGKCKNCYSREYMKTRAQTDRRLRRVYGIGIEEYDRLLAAQGCVCAICGEPERQTHKGTLKELTVDHDHETGAVRGLLCHRCNSALGQVQDNTEVLYNAMIYLRVARMEAAQCQTQQ